MAAAVMTVEFSIIHHYASQKELSEAFIVQFFEADTKIYWTLCKLWHFWLKKNNHVLISNINTN